MSGSRAAHDNLLRTPYGRYRAGVLIKPDGYGGQVAEVLMSFGPNPAGEIEMQVALKLLSRETGYHDRKALPKPDVGA